mmetsp:Transcript_14278/g.34351  ORF Transcript_14278/g.34351 Transcript_14278/m.34351 type:complete len:287 (-) Transcript_14278:1198-2058(-)
MSLFFGATMLGRAAQGVRRSAPQAHLHMRVFGRCALVAAHADADADVPLPPPREFGTDFGGGRGPVLGFAATVVVVGVGAVGVADCAGGNGNAADGLVDSTSWQASKQTVAALFEVYRIASDPRPVGVPMGRVKTQKHVIELCREPVFDGFADYLTRTHRTPQDKPLAYRTVLGYMGCALNMASVTASTVHTDKTALFFTCLDKMRSSTSHAIWYRRLKDKIVRWGFQHSMDTGEDLDKSDTPLYPEDVRHICRALALHGTAEDAQRKFAVKSIAQVAGRGSEYAW